MVDRPLPPVPEPKEEGYFTKLLETWISEVSADSPKKPTN
jgi:hypothetical protein